MKVAEALLWSVAVFILLHTLLQHLTLADSTRLIAAASAAVSVFAFLARKIFQITETRVTNFINHHYAILEESADLMLQEDQTLNALQILQKSKISKQFEITYKSIRLPHKLGQAAGLLLMSTLLLLTSRNENTASSEREGNNESSEIKKQYLPASVESAEIQIKPPGYTQIADGTVNDFNLTIPEGSVVSWSLVFSDTVAQVQIILPQDTLDLKPKGNNLFRISNAFSKPSLYQFRWVAKTGINKSSDYYPISIIPDEPPSITVHNPAPFTSLKVSDNLRLQLDASMQDDYSLTDAYIIATVSKGSGEAVKFREEKLRFSELEKIPGKEVKANRTIDLPTLGLEPGDELYFYIEAMDNKVPEANRTRTETYFISLQDTAAENFTTEAGLGVDLLPDYFRSQRQIIIDTEKLLKDKKALSKQKFNTTSNELGYDQKVLRLKYGQFLGEEFDSGIGPEAEGTEEAHHEEEEDLIKKFGHVHDTENEHNLVAEKKEKDDHHEHGDEESENPLEGFVHEHDNAEEATFFIQSIKLKLKAALTLMWDAELYLHLYEPAKSLPYQYQTLKLLKDISNASRIYVHRTGFDPPPVKEDKRLTGELNDVKSTRIQLKTDEKNNYPAIRKALTVLENVYTLKEIKFSSSDKAILRKAGNEFSSLALDHPEKYLTTLSLLKSLLDDEIKPTKATVSEVRKKFWEALPEEPGSPYTSEQVVHPLDQKFMKQLNELNHE